MKLFQNRHVKVAMLVAPVLSIVSYVAVDHAVSEKPSAAVTGRSYPLAAASSCRYASGYCTLENGDVELKVRARRIDPSEVELTLSSDLRVESALVSVGSGDDFSPPIALEGRERHRVRLPLSDPDQSRLRWAVAVFGATYYAETSAAFVDRKTIISEASP